MTITMVVAASENNVIGIHNQLPWHLPDDLKFFKQTTLGKPVLMGRKTFESMGRALPGRLNIVLSRNVPELPPGVLHFGAANEALQFLENQGAAEVCIIGGGVVFAELLDRADQVFLTRVHTQLAEGEAFFPVLASGDWTKVWEQFHEADEKHPHSFTFEQYKRIQR